MSNTLKSLYVFTSDTTGRTYVLNVTTQALAKISAFGNPNCLGYSITWGKLTVIDSQGNSKTYNLPAGQTPQIYNGLWPNAAQCPDGPGTPLCQGIDRLFVNFSTQSNNTMIVAADDKTITVVYDSTNFDTAKLRHAVFPPKVGKTEEEEELTPLSSNEAIAGA
jgi:hypothetical protein